MIHPVSVIDPSNLGIREALVQHLTIFCENTTLQFLSSIYHFIWLFKVHDILRIHTVCEKFIDDLEFLVVIPLFPFDGLHGKAGPHCRHLLDLGSDSGKGSDWSGLGRGPGRGVVVVTTPAPLHLDDLIVRVSLGKLGAGLWRGRVAVIHAGVAVVRDVGRGAGYVGHLDRGGGRALLGHRRLGALVCRVCGGVRQLGGQGGPPGGHGGLGRGRGGGGGGWPGHGGRGLCDGFRPVTKTLI